MKFLWKSQLRKARGKFQPQAQKEKRVSRGERLLAKLPKRSFFLVYFLWFFFVGTGVYIAFFSSYLALTNVRIDGAAIVPEGEVRESINRFLAQKYGTLLPRNTYLSVRPMKLALELQSEYPLFRSVLITRAFPHDVVVTLEERQTIVLWCGQSDCAHVLEDGSVVPRTEAYEREENRSRTVFLNDESTEGLRSGSGVFDGGFVTLVSTLKDSFRTRLGLETTDTVTFVSRFASELRYQTSLGFELYVSSRLPAEYTLATLELVLREEIPPEKHESLRYIDVRTENRVFYRLKDGVSLSEEAEKELLLPVPVKKEEKKKRD